MQSEYLNEYSLVLCIIPQSNVDMNNKKETPVVGGTATGGGVEMTIDAASISIPNCTMRPREKQVKVADILPRGEANAIPTWEEHKAY